MIEIKDLLSRFDSILLGEEGKKETLRNILSQTIGTKIETKDIKVEHGTVYLNIKPIYKSEILLKKEKIDQMLEEAFGKRAPKQIF
jgi:hypothetical protein